MKALRVHAFDDPASWRLESLAPPRPAPGEVLVQVLASPVSFVDLLLTRGAYQLRPALPWVPGSEFVGRVRECGPGVDASLAPGQGVVGAVLGGAWAQYLCVPARALARLPEGPDPLSACGLAVTAATAVYALEQRARAQPGETLLVLGASGALGSAAVQLGRAMGLRVLASARSPAGREAALGQGADAVIDAGGAHWRERLRALAPEGLDLVFDPVGGALSEPAFRSLRWGGRQLVLGFSEGSIPSLRANLPLLKGASWIGVDVRQFREREPLAAQRNLERTVQWWARGLLQPPATRVHRAQDWAVALEAARRREHPARVVLDWQTMS